MFRSINEFRGHGALLLVSFFYGLNYFVLKDIFRTGMDPFSVLALRCLLTSGFFIFFHLVFVREKVRSKKDYLSLILCALFGITVNQTFYIWGMSKTSEVNAAVLMIPTPVFVFIAAAVLGTEKVTWRKIGGLLLSFVGAAGLILNNLQPGNGQGNITGDLMITINAASYGLYLVLVRPLVLRYNVFTIITWIFIFGSIPNILLGLVPLLNEKGPLIHPGAEWGLLYLILFATIGAYFLNAWAMKRMDPSAVGIYIYVQPVIVTLLSAILGIGGLNGFKLFCMVVIFAGVFFVTTQGNRKKG